MYCLFSGIRCGVREIMILRCEVENLSVGADQCVRVLRQQFRSRPLAPSLGVTLADNDEKQIPKQPYRSHVGPEVAVLGGLFYHRFAPLTPATPVVDVSRIDSFECVVEEAFVSFDR